MKNSLIFFFTLLTVSAFSQPIGWASLNGGTSGGAGGQVVTITNRTELLANVTGEDPKILLIQDTVELNLYERVKVYGNKTIMGATPAAMLRYGGLEIIGNNVILQNLAIGDFYDGDWSGTTHSTDCLTLYGVNIWIDHCWLWAGADGLLDVRSGNNNIADYITVSYTRFSDHNKVSLIGSADSNIECRDHLRITYDHCWWDGTLAKGLNQRLPRVRFGDVHVLNSYYEEVDSYCVAARFESDVVVEDNYFRNVSNPHIMDDFGLGIEDPDLVSIGNIYELCSGSQTTSGTAFTPSDFYSYDPIPAWDVPALVMNEAGPFNPDANISPVAVDDIIDYSGLSGTVNIYSVDNDTDADGGDLRIAQIANDPPGTAHIKLNRIIYTPLPNSTGVDTILYLLVDTQGGVDTGRVLIYYDGINSIFSRQDPNGVVQVYPNPANGLVTVEMEAGFEEASAIEVFDHLGRGVCSDLFPSENKNKYTLDTGFFPEGVYWVFVRAGAHRFTKKLVIVH
ncbi:MAG: T9SS type A sorting domain-containing protein [Lewinellaceae bacterium]|nr:T9SS type A sorting domain-containing protein [Lewinellaceae bacterium]